MTVVVLGVDALDPDLVDPVDHPHLCLERHERIETIVSSAGEPSTHELWPTIITGLKPQKHGLVLDEGVAWENPLIRTGSSIADYILPDAIQTALGAWLLNNTSEDAFRVPASYYRENGLSTVFDSAHSKAIGVPNYVVDPNSEDREHQLRRDMGELFERDPAAKGGHTSANVEAFYEQCLEMVMIRTTRTRRALRGGQYQLVFGYTSGLDLIGHVAHDRPAVQQRAYGEIDEFVGELAADLQDNDELIVLSDHGLQDGLHTQEAMVASTNPDLLEGVSSVLDVREMIESELQTGDHESGSQWDTESSDPGTSEQVAEQLRDLGYM
jgi:predicted AlkP superfamily pyrophosphatase or phosphodiesterase